jgi:hypothetical protein
MPGILLKVETDQDFLYEMSTFLSNEIFHFFIVLFHCRTYIILKDKKNSTFKGIFKLAQKNLKRHLPQSLRAKGNLSC